MATRTAQHCFVTIHPPVVPYGARATWYLYNSERDNARREKLLDLLGKANAFVLGGHIHRFNTICRTTPGGGRFAQMAISSVVGNATVKPDTELDGLKDYNGDQIRVEVGSLVGDRGGCERHRRGWKAHSLAGTSAVRES